MRQIWSNIITVQGVYPGRDDHSIILESDSTSNMIVEKVDSNICKRLVSLYLGCDQGVCVVVGVHPEFLGLGILPNVYGIPAVPAKCQAQLTLCYSKKAQAIVYLTPSVWIFFSYGSENVYCSCACASSGQNMIYAAANSMGSFEHLKRFRHIRCWRFVSHKHCSLLQVYVSSKGNYDAGESCQQSKRMALLHSETSNCGNLCPERL